MRSTNTKDAYGYLIYEGDRVLNTKNHSVGEVVLTSNSSSTSVTYEVLYKYEDEDGKLHVHTDPLVGDNVLIIKGHESS